MNKKIEYNPVPHYIRKLARNFCRSAAIVKYGKHNVNKNMHDIFQVYQDRFVNN